MLSGMLESLRYSVEAPRGLAVPSELFGTRGLAVPIV